MTRWLAVTVATLTLACGSSSSTPAGTGGASGTGGAPAGTGGGGSGTGGAPGTGGVSGTGGAGTGGAGTGGAGTGGSDAAAPSDGGAMDAAAMGADGGADAGVSPDAGGVADTPLDTAPAVASMMFTASGGGTLTSGDATLLIPAGALAADQVITVSTRMPGAGDPGAASISGPIYDFGPAGTTFLRPAILTLTLPVAPPTTKDAIVAWLDEASGQWFPVPSTVSGTKVAGQVSHFTSFAVVLVDKGISCPFSGACGGALDGTWKYSASCIKGKASDPIECSADGSVVAPVYQDYAIEGTVTITGGRYTANQTITGRSTIFYTPECFAAIKGTAGDPMDCPGVQTFLNANHNGYTWVCSGSTAQGCSCSYTQSFAQMPTGAVVVSGQQVAFNQDGKPPEMPGDYCVKGNTITVKDSDGTVFTAVKQ